MNGDEMQTDEVRQQFVDAALDEDWELVDELRAQLGSALDRPYTSECRGPVESGVPYSRKNRTRRHRFVYYRMYDEERCMYCGCQRE